MSVEVAEATRRGEDQRLAALLFITFLLVYAFLYHGHFSGSDEEGIFLTARAIYETGDLALPQGKHVYPGRDRRGYSIFAAGQALLAVPFYAAGSLAVEVLPASWQRVLAGPVMAIGGASVERFAVGLYAPTASALLVAIFFLFERQLGVSRRSAIAASALLGATTYVAIMSVFFLRHTTEALLALASLYCFHRFRKGASLFALALGCLLASAVVVVRIPAALVGPGLAGYLVYVLRERSRAEGASWRARALAAAGLPTLAMAAVHFGVQYWKWGTWISSPMTGQAFATPLWTGLTGLLLSPGCSIFAYSPLLLLIPWTLPGFWRAARAECVAVLAVCLTFLFVVAKYEYWTGLWSAPGPRYLFLATPLLMLPLGGWLDGPRSRIALASVGALAFVGAAVQLSLAAVQWGVVIATMGYTAYAPHMSFVFVPELSPILGGARLLLEGRIDSWLWGLFWGWPGLEGEPGAALFVLLLGLAALGMCAVLLVRGARKLQP